MILKIFKWVGLVLIFAITALIMSSCTMLGLNYASLETANKPAPGPALDAAGFAGMAPDIRKTFEEQLYGPWPANLPIRAGAWRMVDSDYLGGAGTLQEVPITVGSGEGARTFHLAVALPKRASNRPVPILIGQTFSDNCSVFPDAALTAPEGSLCDGSRMTGLGGFMVTRIFGTYIARVPMQRYFDAGLGYANFHGSELVPDSKAGGPPVLAALSPGPVPTGTLMAWAYGFHAAALVLETDPRIRKDATIPVGHSRYGKAGLIAAAWADNIDGAVAHQSGFAGAASSRSPTGERLDRMAKTYPHWLAPVLQEHLDDPDWLTYDQHYLLALAAPKPLFLGNGRRDVWSDPNSTWRNAQAADVIYEALGVSGLPETNMQDFQPGAELSYYLRPGGHSVVSEDIDAFIAFMRAHFETPARADKSIQMPQ